MLVPTVSAVVVTWNSMPLVEVAVECLRRQTQPPFELIVVDNGSVDGTRDWLRRQPDVLLLENPANRGFAAANNQGIARASGQILLLVNADIELEPGYVEECLAHFSNPAVGSVTGKLLRVRPPDIIDSTGHDVYAVGWAQNRGEELPATGFETADEVFGVCAAAGLYRRAALQAVALGGQVFDETYGSYVEDVDLDWRLRWSGWQAWYEPAGRGRHHRHGSGGPSSARVMRDILKNRLLTVVKNYDRAWLPRYAPGVLGFTLVKTADFARRHPSAALGLVDFVRLLPDALGKRRQVAAMRRRPAADMRRWLLPFPVRDRVRRRISR
ncbi:MAG: glycosyltransferase family 2 protein [Candidatus Dormibacteria bacterium]